MPCHHRLVFVVVVVVVFLMPLAVRTIRSNHHLSKRQRNRYQRWEGSDYRHHARNSSATFLTRKTFSRLSEDHGGIRWPGQLSPTFADKGENKNWSTRREKEEEGHRHSSLADRFNEKNIRGKALSRWNRIQLMNETRRDIYYQTPWLISAKTRERERERERKIFNHRARNNDMRLSSHRWQRARRRKDEEEIVKSTLCWGKIFTWTSWKRRRRRRRRRKKELFSTCHSSAFRMEAPSKVFLSSCVAAREEKPRSSTPRHVDTELGRSIGFDSQSNRSGKARGEAEEEEGEREGEGRAKE